MEQFDEYNSLFFLLIFIVLSAAFAVASLIAAFVCSYKSSDDDKQSTYECGMKLFSDARIRFDIKFLNFAILFLIFDVETIFLFPFAVSFNELGIFAIVEVFIFVILLVFALFYAARKNLLRMK